MQITVPETSDCTVDVTVNLTPTITATLQNQTVCSGATFPDVIFSSTVPGTVYNWVSTVPEIHY